MAHERALADSAIMLPSTPKAIEEGLHMTRSLGRPKRLLCVAFAILFGAILVRPGFSRASGQPNSALNAGCHVEGADYKGWHAQQLSNSWVQLIVVPQNGGRLMQLTFGGHPYLFVNPRYAGKYLPPTPGHWFNYGGDKLWLLPEGNNDEQHWVGNSDLLDDGPFVFRKLEEGTECQVELTSQADPQTGIQFVRTITLEAGSPRVRFHASMKNVSGHTVEWSMQSVSQYDTSDAGSAASQDMASRINHNFWTFTPANPSSGYLNHYHVRFGPAENPAVSMRDDGLFALHYAHMAAELWLDSTAGWLAVVDEDSQYALVERFQYEEHKPYPGKASVIFWTNGPEIRLNSDGIPSLSADSDASPIYLEAEINSPICRLRPGESCNLDTEWFPTRVGKEFHGVADPGIVVRPLQARQLANGKISFSGSYGVFFSGHLVARFYDEHGSKLGTTPIADVTPTEPVSLDTAVAPPGKPVRVSLHLEDQNGVDHGAVQEVRITSGDSH
jgi:hypothetical protein